MRKRAPLIPYPDSLLYEYVLTIKMLGGTVIDSSIEKAAMDAFKAKQAEGRLVQRFILELD